MSSMSNYIDNSNTFSLLYCKTAYSLEMVLSFLSMQISKNALGLLSVFLPKTKGRSFTKHDSDSPCNFAYASTDSDDMIVKGTKKTR